MNRSFRDILFTAGLTISLIGAGQALAQETSGSSNAPAVSSPNAPTGGGDNSGFRRGGGNFDPARMQQQILDRVKERLEVTDDSEWKIISGLVQKVMDARRATLSGMGFGMRRGGNGGGGEGNSESNRGGDNNRGGGRGWLNQTPSPEADDLQKALDAKAPADELKAKLAKFRDSRKQKEATLATAQENLRNVLSVRQEAEATMMGLLP